MAHTHKRKIHLMRIIILLTLSLPLLYYLYRTMVYQESVRSLHIQDIALSAIPNGTYVGECDVDFIYVKAGVAVQDGKITDIQLYQHKNERGASAEALLQKILAEQSLNVENVAGATNSSKVIKKAIENALTAGAVQP